jgi:hypothetical protein
MTSGPHTARLPGRGFLKHGNRTGNPDNAPRCGARTRSGAPCKGPAMPNGRCRMHGGLSTGARTPEGKARCAAANWKHGRRSQATIQQRREARAALRMVRELLAAAEGN